MVSRRKNKIPKSDFDYDEGEVCGFTDDAPIGESCISSFSFNDDSVYETIETNPKCKANENSTIKSTDKNNTLDNNTTTQNMNIENTMYTPSVPKNISSSTKDIFDNRRTPIANGAAPPIDGEAPNIKRTYTLRISTIRKINELKSIHPDINVCVSSIVDIAIDHYHNHIVNEDGIQWLLLIIALYLNNYLSLKMK